jgi:pyruvate carboxylase subunit B
MEQNQWDMILGKCGRLPGPLAPEIIELAKEKGFEFFDGVPQDNYPDELPKYRKMMEEKGWDVGQDEEELFEYAMHERQYVDYKEGRAKQNFNRELEDAMAKKQSGGAAPVQKDRQQLVLERVQKQHPDANPIVAPVSGQILWEIAVGEKSMAKPVGTPFKTGDTVCTISTYYGMEPVESLFDGKLLEVVAEQGQNVNKGDVIAFVK